MIGPFRRIKGTSRPEVTRAAWTTIERDFPNGTYLFTAETTGCYWSTDDQVPTVAPPTNEGDFLPRDWSMIIELEGGDKFHYYLPAGGTLRRCQVELL